jgi:hypothetical protein
MEVNRELGRVAITKKAMTTISAAGEICPEHTVNALKKNDSFKRFFHSARETSAAASSVIGSRLKFAEQQLERL